MEWLIEQFLFLTITACCQANLCDSVYKVKSVCNMNYGTALSTYTNFRGRAWCTVACSQDSACMSSVYDTVAGTCQTFSEYKRIDLCVTEEYYTAVFEVYGLLYDFYIRGKSNCCSARFSKHLKPKIFISSIGLCRTYENLRHKDFSETSEAKDFHKFRTAVWNLQKLCEMETVWNLRKC